MQIFWWLLPTELPRLHVEQSLHCESHFHMAILDAHKCQKTRIRLHFGDVSRQNGRFTRIDCFFSTHRTKINDPMQKKHLYFLWWTHQWQPTATETPLVFLHWKNRCSSINPSYTNAHNKSKIQNHKEATCFCKMYSSVFLSCSKNFNIGSIRM